MKGIVLAGGSGSRLYPITMATSKQLLPVYNKPMIYYPLSVLMLAGIREILIISTPSDLPNFKRLLGNGSNFGIRLSYVEQPSPDGLAQALMIGEEFIGNESVALVLGDNIFYGAGLKTNLKTAVNNAENGFATIFGYYVSDPERFGIVEIDSNGEIKSIEEKPKHPKSNYCVTGMYFYPAGVSNIAATLEKSERGEYEITDLNNKYLKEQLLKVILLGRGYAWLDTGTVESLFDASLFIKTIQQRQGIEISALEEISFVNGWITEEKLVETSISYGNSPYGKHLKNVAKSEIKY